MLYLIVACIWLILGIAMILVPEHLPEALTRPIPGTTLSMGWIPLFLALWNVYRWRQWQAVRQARRQQTPQRARANPEYHPEFDFHGDDKDAPPDK